MCVCINIHRGLSVLLLFTRRGLQFARAESFMPWYVNYYVGARVPPYVLRSSISVYVHASDAVSDPRVSPRSTSCVRLRDRDAPGVFTRATQLTCAPAVDAVAIGVLQILRRSIPRATGKQPSGVGRRWTSWTSLRTSFVARQRAAAPPLEQLHSVDRADRSGRCGGRRAAAPRLAERTCRAVSRFARLASRPLLPFARRRRIRTARATFLLAGPPSETSV